MGWIQPTNIRHSWLLLCYHNQVFLMPEIEICLRSSAMTSYFIACLVKCLVHSGQAQHMLQS
jgi:hypothetical protein